jgi:DNA/RNA endonuclease G (NUC1)
MATRRPKPKASSKAASLKRKKFMESLKQFIRAKGSDYLRDKNIWSIGIGYKISDGKPTKEIAIQFTVKRKAAPELLESLGTQPIPETIIVDNVKVPTDVIQRTYEPSFRVVAEAATPLRKSRIEPIVPGVSVANKNETAGTIEKLEISLEAPVTGGPAEAVGTGYDANFLGKRIDVPKLNPSIQDDAFKLNGSEVIQYTHFSLALSKSRRFAFWVGWNIDGGRLKKLDRKGIPFIFDPRIPAGFQVGDQLYADNRLDRGHVARRADLLWGSLVEAKKANKDSFLFTNITPQMDDFNQSRQAGLWGQLEDAVFADVVVEDLRVSVYGGPVFQDDDRVFRQVRIPREFWKVLAFVEEGKLKSKAFLLTQNLDQLEVLELDEFRVFQVTLVEVEQRCQFRFPDVLRAADGFAERLARRPETLAERKPLESLADIEW